MFSISVLFIEKKYYKTQKVFSNDKYLESLMIQPYQKASFLILRILTIVFFIKQSLEELHELYQKIYILFPRLLKIISIALSKKIFLLSRLLNFYYYRYLKSLINKLYFLLYVLGELYKNCFQKISAISLRVLNSFLGVNTWRAI